MDFHRDWIEKPRRVILLLVFFCLLTGMLGLSIPIGYSPQSLKKSVVITIENRGAFEEEIERTIVDRLEADLLAVAGITEIFSVAEMGKARLIITLSDRTDLNTAFLAVREIVYAAYTKFPSEVQRPAIVKSDPLGKPVFIVGFPDAGTMGEEELKRIYENVEGSGEIIIAGSSKQEMRVIYDPQKLSAAGLGLDELIRAIRNANVLGGFGREAGPPHVVDNRFRNIDEMQRLMVSPEVSLSELASIEKINRRPEIVGRVNGEQRLILYVQPEGDANVLALCGRLEGLTETLPNAKILYSYGRLVRKALLQILSAAGIGAACVVLLTYLFLGSLVPAALVSANIPFSILASLAFLRICGEELNILSLSGIVVGIGLVIDAGVVFNDAYFRYGRNYATAVSRARAPILFAGATTVAVFLPLLFTPSVLVDQLRGLALSIVGSVAASCVFVFCFIPVFLHNIYRRPAEVRQSRRRQWKRFSIRALRDLMFIMNRFRWPLLMVVISLAGFVLFLVIGLDRQDLSFNGLNQKIVHFSIEYPSGYTLEHVMTSGLPLERRLLACNGVEQVSSRYERERAAYVVQLNSSASKREVVYILEKEEGSFGEAFLHFPDGTAGTTSFPVNISGADPNELASLAQRLAREVQKLPECRAVLFHFKNVLPAKQLYVDLDKAAQAGVDPGDLCSQMYWALAGPVLDKWTTGQDEMDIILQTRTLDTNSRNLASLLQLPCGKTTFTINSLVGIREKPQAGRIYHLNRARSVSISILADLHQRRQVIADTENILESFGIPPGYRAQIGKEVEEQRLLSRTVYTSLGLAVLLIFFILMFQFESLGISAAILLQIPGAFIFPLLLLRIFSWSLTIPVIIGLILTSGIAVNNAILVFVDLRDIRLTMERIFQVLAEKIRPIVVSSLTTMVGIAPLLFAESPNQGILAPLSITVAAGIAGSIPVLIVSLSLIAAKE
ncbi:MAG: efflux RND transporter permease subunit [Spirochaetaceae bacterium]|nr:MAG: efflux RND transporter permease subunit [Spirochaetaceae bacterium]